MVLILLVIAFSVLAGALIPGKSPDLVLLPTMGVVLCTLLLLADIRRNERSIDQTRARC